MATPESSMGPDSKESEFLDFEVANDGAERNVVIGKSFEQLRNTMALYYPDPEERADKMYELFQKVVDKGLLQDVDVRMSPKGSSGLDLSDKAISEAFPDPNADASEVDLSDEAIEKAFFADQSEDKQGE